MTLLTEVLDACVVIEYNLERSNEEKHTRVVALKIAVRIKHKHEYDIL
jgi:hypothetical protein